MGTPKPRLLAIQFICNSFSLLLFTNPSGGESLKIPFCTLFSSVLFLLVLFSIYPKVMNCAFRVRENVAHTIAVHDFHCVRVFTNITA